MGVFLTILTIAALIVLIIAHIFFLVENEGMLNDQIVKDYLDKLGDQYSVYTSEHSQSIDPKYSANVKKSIERSPAVFRFLFPYYMEYVGIIPVWSKSKSRIDAMFATGIKRNFKREKLGLE
jgi:hypothetical protein